ncbi:hypothetical protein B0I37DRAFT_358951 [Chaetomium sp. MPI-CAGE-AT-0009]|nr:hypothetical protein B0I37DRAFT_358951 [Chaetomium sp. MPI-CAGE-AT-0009]
MFLVFLLHLGSGWLMTCLSVPVEPLHRQSVRIVGNATLEQRNLLAHSCVQAAQDVNWRYTCYLNLNPLRGIYYLSLFRGVFECYFSHNFLTLLCMILW